MKFLKVIFISSAVLIFRGCKEEVTLPVVITVNVQKITWTTAVIAGAITDEGGTQITVQGVCCGTSPDCNINDKHAQSLSVGFGPYSATITEITANTLYYARAWARNLKGISYGAPVPFTTKESFPPALTTTDIRVYDQTSATTGGNITNDFGTPVTSRGVCWDNHPMPTIDLPTKTSDDNGIGMFSSFLTKLNPATKYYIRAYATNSIGTGYGNEVTLTTPPAVVPKVTTNPVTTISNTSAISGGEVLNDFGSPVTVHGICWSTSPVPTVALTTRTNDGAGSGSYTSNLKQLVSNTKYYVKAYATNSAGTGYGDEITFTTLPESEPDTTVTDVEGNKYKFVRIGNQVWMAANLRTTKYSDNSPILAVPGYSDWIVTNKPAYCWYENNETKYKSDYGALYNWYVTDPLSNGGKNVCPVGWHVPSESEWASMVAFFGDELLAGSGLKEAGTNHWASPNTGATNESKFTALPAGYREAYSGSYFQLGYYTSFWSTIIADDYNAYYRELSYYYGTFLRKTRSKRDGCSIRCIRD